VKLVHSKPHLSTAKVRIWMLPSARFKRGAWVLRRNTQLHCSAMQKRFSSMMRDFSVAEQRSYGFEHTQRATIGLNLL